MFGVTQTQASCQIVSDVEYENHSNRLSLEAFLYGVWNGIHLFVAYK